MFNRLRLQILAIVASGGAAAALPAQTFTTLAHFAGKNGFTSALAQGSDGNFYGTATGQKLPKYWPATVYRIGPSGPVEIVHKIGLANPGNLLLMPNGDMYGTTAGGGKAGGGNIFKIRLDGKLKTVYRFTTAGDGAEPIGGLIRGMDGDLYGTTVYGGNGWGTVFKMTPQGNITVLHRFHHKDGAEPYGALVQASDGNFYGTTSTGGDHVAQGTIFRITPTGKFDSLYTFCSLPNCADGVQPSAGLVQALDGNLYGTTSAGGGTQSGTIFRLALDGTLTTIYTFSNNENPQASLIQAADGNLYGTAYDGGVGGGYVFNVTLSGDLSILYEFCSLPGCSDGIGPFGGVIQATDGNFYGTTAGNHHVKGTVYSVSTGLSPFVSPLPSSGKSGESVTILGTGLSGATSVTFNHLQATFTVNSSGSAIAATVPVGASSGALQVTLASGSVLSGNVPFNVRP